MSVDELERFKIASRTLAKRAGGSLNAFFNDAEAYGLTPSWIRDRYYGRINVRTEDADTLMVFLLKERAGKTATQDAAAYRTAVRRMCLACDGGEDEAKASCWDNTCPLRPVSPLPYKHNEDRLP